MPFRTMSSKIMKNFIKWELFPLPTFNKIRINGLVKAAEYSVIRVIASFVYLNGTLEETDYHKKMITTW